jgi:hypothetical protein
MYLLKIIDNTLIKITEIARNVFRARRSDRRITEDYFMSGFSFLPEFVFIFGMLFR